MWILRIQETELSLPIFVYDLNSKQLLENYPACCIWNNFSDRKTQSNLMVSSISDGKAIVQQMQKGFMYTTEDINVLKNLVFEIVLRI